MRKLILLTTMAVAMAVSVAHAATPGVNIDGGDIQTGYFHDLQSSSVTIEVTWSQPDRDLSLSLGYPDNPTVVSDSSSESDKQESITVICPCDGPFFITNKTDKLTKYTLEFVSTP